MSLPFALNVATHGVLSGPLDIATRGYRVSAAVIPPVVFAPRGGAVPEVLRRIRRRDAEVEVTGVLAFATLGTGYRVLIDPELSAGPAISGVVAQAELGSVQVSAIQNLSDEELLILISSTWRRT